MLKSFASLPEERKRRVQLECSIGALVCPLLFVLVDIMKSQSGAAQASGPQLLWLLLAGCAIQTTVMATCLWGVGSRRMAKAAVAWAALTMGGYTLSRML